MRFLSWCVAGRFSVSLFLLLLILKPTTLQPEKIEVLHQGKVCFIEDFEQLKQKMIKATLLVNVESNICL